MFKFMSKVAIGIVVLSVAIVVLGSIASEDLEGQESYEQYACEMVNSGAWGAGEARKAECKAYKG